MTGRFIVLEGIDGSGKGTQLELLQEALEAQGKKVWTTREPSDSPIGRMIRQGLTGGEAFDEATMALLFAADRLVHIDEVKAHLKNGEIVLCDRYILSSLAYNSQSLSLEWILSLNKEADKRLQPDLTLLFDLSAQDAMKRINARGEQAERYETQSQLYQVGEMYRMLADVRTGDNVTCINATQAPEDVHKDVMKAVGTLR